MPNQRVVGPENAKAVQVVLHLQHKHQSRFKRRLLLQQRHKRQSRFKRRLLQQQRLKRLSRFKRLLLLLLHQLTRHLRGVYLIGFSNCLTLLMTLQAASQNGAELLQTQYVMHTGQPNGLNRVLCMLFYACWHETYNNEL
jgi:hypothetical protein